MYHQQIYLGILASLLSLVSFAQRDQGPPLRPCEQFDAVTIPATYGERTIFCDENKLPSTYYFQCHGCDEYEYQNMFHVHNPRPEAKISIMVLHTRLPFTKIYASIGRSLDELCVTQDQIITFCNEYYTLVCDDREDIKGFFLFKVGDAYWVAHVFPGVRGKKVFLEILPFSDNRVWDDEGKNRFFLPALL